MGNGPATLVAASDRPVCLTAKNMGICNAVPGYQTSDDTNRANLLHRQVGLRSWESENGVMTMCCGVTINE